jgi:hypothetical protein
MQSLSDMSIEPPLTILYFDPNPRKFSLEEQADSLIQHPEQLKNMLANLWIQPEGDQSAKFFLREWIRKYETYPEVVKKCIFELLLSFPLSTARSFLKNEPLLLFQSFQCLDLEKRQQIIRILIYQLEKVDLSLEGFLLCFETLAQQGHDRDLVKFILNKIVSKFQQTKRFANIVDQFCQLSLQAQVCLLEVMTSSQQIKVFKTYQQDLGLMATWMDELFRYESDFMARQHILARIFDSLEEGVLADFFEVLTDQNAQVGAYLFVCLSLEQLQEFILNVQPETRTQLLLNSPADATSWEILAEIQAREDRHPLIFEIMGLKIEDSVVTLSQCFQLLQDISFNPELAPDYNSFMVHIPPILIGALATTPTGQEVLANLINHFNDEQLKFFACTLLPEPFSVLMEKNRFSLNNGQLIALLEGVSTNAFLYYVKVKIAQLQEIHLKFRQKYQELNHFFSEIEKGERITSTHLAQLQQRSHELHAMARYPSLMDYCCLWKFLQDTHLSKCCSQDDLIQLEQVKIELQQAMNHLNPKRFLFEGQHAFVRIKLDELSTMVLNDEEKHEDIDLTSELYPRFWSLIREETLSYLGMSSHSQLGITHAGQLTCLGIRSDQDLEQLGISLQWQERVEKLVAKIGKSETVKALWKKCVDIKLEEAELKVSYKQIVEALINQQPNFLELKEDCLLFCSEILIFQHLSKGDRNDLEKGIEFLKKYQDQTESKEIVSQMFERGWMILRGQHPLFCLQRYLLTNHNLKQTWEAFHSQGYFSITDLIKKSLIQASIDLLNLEKVAHHLY